MLRKLSTINVSKHIDYARSPLSKIISLNTRNTVASSTSTNVNKENWTEIYRLPLVRLASAFNKLKIYQAALTIVGTPVSYALESAGLVDQSFTAVVASLGFTGLLTLTLCSFPIRNLIGFVYINDKEDTVKVAYVDFWGRRKEQNLVIDNILGLWEIPPSRLPFYQAVKSRDGTFETYKLVHRYGIIRDKQRYVSIFGESNL